MKAVSEGAKRKAEVLETCLQQMKACFLDVSLYLLILWKGKEQELVGGREGGRERERRKNYYIYNIKLHIASTCIHIFVCVDLYV